MKKEPTVSQHVTLQVPLTMQTCIDTLYAMTVNQPRDWQSQKTMARTWTKRDAERLRDVANFIEWGIEMGGKILEEEGEYTKWLRNPNDPSYRCD